MCQSGVVRQPLKGQVIAMNNTTYAVDLAKKVVQVHWVEPLTGEIKRKALVRAEVSAFFARREPGLMVMEACGSAHHWGRVLSKGGVFPLAAEAAGWVGREPGFRSGRGRADFRARVGASAAGNRCRRCSSRRVHRARPVDGRFELTRTHHKARLTK